MIRQYQARPAGQGVPVLHPLVQRNTSDLSEQRFSTRLTGEEFFLADHVVQGKRVLPGVAYLEMARAALIQAGGLAESAGVRLKEVAWARPLVVEAEPVEVHIGLYPEEGGAVGFEIYSGEERVHSLGTMETFQPGAAERLDLAALRAQCGAATLAGSDCYARFAALGLAYGPAQQAIEAIHVGAGQALARLQLPASVAAGVLDYVLHPSLLDAGLQAVAGLAGDEQQGQLALPFAVATVEIVGRCTPQMWALVKASGDSTAQVRKYDVTLCDDEGVVAVRLLGFAARVVEGQLGAGSVLLLRPEWRRQPAQGAAPQYQERHAVLCGVGVAAPVLQERMGDTACVELAAGNDLAADYGTAVQRLCAAVQAILQGKPAGPVLLQVVVPAEGPRQALAGLAGLLRTARQEQPKLVGQLIAVGSGVDADALAAMLAANAACPQDVLIRHVDGQREVAGWEEMTAEAAAPPWKADGVYLLTGGLGGLGQLFATEIARRARGVTLVLTGRRELDDAGRQHVRALEALGATVAYRALDVADREAVRQLVLQVREEYQGLHGIVHAAGVLRDSLLLKKTPEEVEAVLAPKVAGLLHLDEASRDVELDWLICFSSTSAALGNAGQADYAAANGFLDSYAHYRNGLAAQGLRHGRTVSLNWPLWKEGGMRMDAASEARIAQLTGLTALASEAGFEALYGVLGAGVGQAMVLQGAPAKVRRWLAESTEPPRIAKALPAKAAGAATDAGQLKEKALQHFKRLLARVFKLPADRIDADAQLDRYGIDSILVTQLTTELEKTFGPLSKTLLFEYQTLDALSGYFIASHHERLAGLLKLSQPGRPDVEPPGVPAHPPARTRRQRFALAAQGAPGAAPVARGHGGIAIIGAAGRYPQARDLKAFWDNLREGRDCVTEVPPERWDHSRYFDPDKNKPGFTYSKWGGFIDGVDEFDPQFFNMSPREAEFVDPQERLFLQCVHGALEDAGYTREALGRHGRERKVGVYAGVFFEEYQLYGAQEQARGNHLALGGSPASIANRVSYHFNLHGPSLSMDSMCSSSLTAIHLACESLLHGKCEMAIAGGVNVTIHPNKYLLLAQGKFASSKGRCESFGEGGDGYVPAEGVGALILKPLEQAIADGDHIYGVIKATALNHGGKTNGYTVPNPLAQAAVIGQALKEAGVDPRTISYVEAHGTGTALGDPIEITGLSKAFGEHTADRQFCAIGSVKSNIGHGEAVAGVAGVTKVLLQLQYGQLAPSLHSQTLNPNIDFAATPFVVQRELAEWKRPVLDVDGRAVELPRRAGVSSFGAGGSNAHVVIEEYVAEADARPTAPLELPVALLLSAKNPERLQEYARHLAEAIGAAGWSDAQLADIAYTLQVGREAMEERLALLVSSMAELREKLAAYLAGEHGIDNLYRGQTGQSRESLAALAADDDMAVTIGAWVAKGKLDKLLELWVKGFAFDWNGLYGANRPRRVSLPTYPFARERYWVPQFGASAADQAVGAMAFLHPLVQRNTSDLSEQRFSSRFSGGEFFLADHVVQGRRILPAVAYLEMARAALLQAGGADAGGGVRLKNVVWARPVVADQPVEVHIGLYPEADGSVGFAVYSDADVVHSQGTAEALPAGAAERLDPAALRTQCDRLVLDGAECYRRFAALGLAYGPAQQAIEVIYVGAGQALARLQLPASLAASGGDYVLHPSLLDAALQAVAGLAPDDGAAQLALPFAVREVDVVGRCGERMWAWVRPEAGSTLEDRVRKVDITLCDDEGVVCAQLKGFASRPLDGEGFAGAAPDDGAERLTLLAPVWDVVAPAVQAAPGRVLLVGGGGALRETLRRQFQGEVAELDAAGSPAALAAALAAQGEIEHLLWVAPEAGSPGLAEDAMIAAQHDGVLQCFRLVKALLEAGYGSRALRWSVLTAQTQAVHADEAVNPAHAGVHGLIGSLAKEYLNWQLRLVDMPQDGAWPVAEALRLAPDAQGNGWAWRGGQWYRQQLLPARVAAGAAAPYRRGGVYLVIGGAGGIGEVWSEHVIRGHAAQVVWIGRRPADADIEAKIGRLARLGPAPLYIAADAADRQALERACRQVKERFGAIHGVIHSAIVLRDQSLANMDEARFGASLSAKVDVSVRLAQVFGEAELGGALDFVLFFSSLQSFTKAAGQSNYAAGCTFKDAFAHQLGRVLPCRVRVMNWGWWGGVGVVASSAYRERMAQMGLASIEPDEGMAALATLLGGGAGQLALLKTTAQAARQGPQFAEAVQVFAPQYAALLGTLDTSAGKALAPAGQAEARAFDAPLQAMLGRLLCGQLQALGLGAGQQGTAAECAAALGLPAMYGRWFEQSLRLLAEQGYLQFDGGQVSTRGMAPVDMAAAWTEWEERKALWLETPAFRAQVALVETTLRALPDILGGRVPATEVMFPGSSMRLVEGVYKHNPVADYFNAVLAEVVLAFVQARLRQDPGAQVRILEIGAGTGGTSALLFERLRPYAAHVGEYCYTDLSKAFLFHAEKEYGPANPYLRYQLFDAGRSLAEQDLQAGSYDLVVATNVLHATGNIRQSVRNAKAALRANGLLLLNEISRSHVFTHLTFGLLEGWWLYEDPELRIPGCPGLSAEGWRKVLRDEGFGAVVYPAGDKEALGQQIIAAESDGVARQRLAPPPVRQPLQPNKPAEDRPGTPSLPHSPLHERAVAYFTGLLAKTLKLPSHKISSAEPLEKYGIDSILVVEMTTALQGVFENVSSTLFFEYRTIDELAGHFIKTQPEALGKVLKLTPGSAVGAAPQAQAARIAAPARTARRLLARGPAQPAAPGPLLAGRDVAIVGMSGRYAQAGNVDEFWENLKQGRNCISEIPAERWDHRRYFDAEKGRPGKSYSKWGGFIDGVDRFDPLFFNIAPREAEHMDPQERLFLMEAYASIEDAGYTPASLSPSGKVGVFAGVMNSNYGSGTRYWSIANRVSYLFNFQGPSLAVDTACSSSLTAVHLALESLRSGACDVAIAGGVNVIIDPVQYVALSAMNMLSAGDSCRSFGDGADGFVDGEGVGALVLKPLHQAIADGDPVYGVIKASALNHGGKTNGYTVPNPHAQAALVAGALAEAGIDPRSISYLEAHGTGTPLGDPIEIAGLSKAFGATTQERQFCAIGSVKSNIGHCESAAGIAAVTKVLLQLKHGQLAPSLHAEVLNPHIDFAATPFRVQRELGEWLRPADQPRRAGISSFGAGGANAHLVIEEYVAPVEQSSPRLVSANEPVLVVLSAKNEERLRERAQQLLAAIAATGWRDEKLAGLAYTLQVGREAMDERLALLVGSTAELHDKLAAYLAGDDSIEHLYRGQVKRNKEAMAVFAADEELQEAVAKWSERKKFGKVLDLWVKGLAFDWNMLYGEGKPQRMSLPTYPFARERYWLDRAAAPAVAAADVAVPAPDARAAGSAGRLSLLAPVWQPEQPVGTGEPARGGVLIVGGTALQQDMLRRQYRVAQLADFAPGNSIAEIADALAGHDDFDQLVWIVPEALSLDVADEALIAAQRDGVLHGFRLVKALLATGYGGKALEWSVFTTQTQAVGGDEVIAPAHAGIHGLIGALAKEYPNWTVRLIDFPAGGAWPLAQALALATDAQGNSWAWRSGQWYRQQLLPAEVPLSGRAAYRQGGVYVVIGGAGGIGEAWSAHVIGQYGAQVIWIGRRPLDAAIQGRIDRLARLGPAPHYIAADAGNLAALRQARETILQRFGSIHGVIHSALVLGDQSLANMDEARFGASLSAKVDVSVRLAQVFGGGDALDFVLFFSSLQSFARGAGQSNYAAGCLFKDAFAQRLGQLWPCPVKVMNWGWWGSVGVAAAPAYQGRMQQLGLASIEPEEGWAALTQLLDGRFGQLALLKTAAAQPAAAPARTPPATPAAVRFDDEQLRQLGVAAFKKLVGGLLHVPEQQIDATESLATYGIDSISVNQLCGLLVGVFADVNNALFFDCQSIDELIAHFLATQRDALAAWVAADALPQPAHAAAPQLAEALAAVQPQQECAAQPAMAAPPQQGGAAGIAIVGIACRFPDADSLDAYWQMLRSGSRADNRGPLRRWPERAADGGASPQSWGAFLDGVDRFDAAFFGIAPLHAETIDPQERLFLMSCWHALEDAGYGNDKWLAERSRAGEDVGVFAGVTSASYNLIGFEQSLAGTPRSTGLSFASIANRVSHALGLTGPSLAVDTMCSSSPVALHLACESLRRGECSMAIAGGVNLNLHPSRLDAMAEGKLICEDGASRSFAAGGKGFLAGEGVAAVVLKPLEAALRDGDTIHAVIKGSAVGHSGSTLNYFSPSSRGQGRVIASALESAGLGPDEVGYVEMQCVGDEATDAAEFEAIKSAYQTRQRRGEPLRLGSVKPNVGHAEAAAGMAQLLKVVLQLKHRMLVPTLIGGDINPQLNFAGANVAIQQELEAWSAAPLRVAINAFGAGGTAAHLIVESCPPAASALREDGPQLLVLSARSRAALRRSAEALAQRLAAEPAGLADVAYTLQVGRREFPHRLALVAESLEDALAQLHGWLADAAGSPVLATPAEGIAPVAGQPAAIEALAAAGDWSGLARVWIGGASIDWRKALSHPGRRRVALPGCAFDLRSFWPETGTAPAPAAVAPLALPPPARPVVGPVVAAEEFAGGKAGLLQSIATPADAAAYLDEQIKSIAEHLRLATVAILYAVLNDKGVLFEERRGADGAIALYPQPAGGDAAATERLLERLTAGAADGADAASGKGGATLAERLGGRAMQATKWLLERLPGGGDKAAARLLKLVPGAQGLTAAYLLKLLAKTPFIVNDEAGARLALPATIRSRKQLEELRLQYEINLRALPEYQSYCELLVAILSGILDGQRPGPEQLAAASALLVDMFTVPSKLAFLNRMTADLCLAGRWAGRETIAVLAIGAGGFEFLSAIVAAAPPGARIEYRVVAGWPQVAKGITELGRERYPGVSFVSFVPMVPGALAAHLGESRYDVVLVNLQDPCAQEAAGLLDKLAADGRESLVFVSEAIESQGLQLILDLTGMWPQVLAKPGVPDRAALGDTLLRAGYRRQAIVDPVLTVFSREALAGYAGVAQASGGPDEAELADIRQFLQQTFADAVDDGSINDPQQNLADAGLPSMTWALIFAKLRQRFGKVIEPGFFAEAGAAPSVESLTRLLAGKLQAGAVLPPVPPIPDALAGLAMQRLVDAGQTEVVFEHAAQLGRGKFSSARGQVFEYFECGSGPALIFLTALAFSKSVWEDQIREFGGHYRLIFPHLPGHAGSVHGGVGFTFEELADDLVELMDALDVGEAHLVGWCIAGNIAQLLALRHPQRLKSLALVCTTPTDARMRGITQKDLEDYSVSPLLTYQMEFNNIYHEKFLAPEVARSLAIIRQTHVAVEPQALLSFIDSLFQFDTRKRLHEIQVPTLVVAGSCDIAFPVDQVALLKDGIRHSRFVVFDRSGHLPFLSQSSQFNAALRGFLDEASSSKAASELVGGAV
ncbi:SDR family NAD(P)-dependent oxidoreductase [Janthinobacterium sp. hw3]|uniref:SDR family NAD(P)-dependent oxidoreductase n=1 Tax=Janthinobacterium fluminis TaxID=2987524 RepID=A0ABT5K0N2_9BURK|nr:SDR family NAD(P)-dependent oxidoreductase [Janthinobacterium fluminis]